MIQNKDGYNIATSADVCTSLKDTLAGEALFSFVTFALFRKSCADDEIEAKKQQQQRHHHHCGGEPDTWIHRSSGKAGMSQLERLLTQYHYDFQRSIRDCTFLTRSGDWWDWCGMTNDRSPSEAQNFSIRKLAGVSHCPAAPSPPSLRFFPCFFFFPSLIKPLPLFLFA